MCVYCGACCAPGAVSACCTCRMCWQYVCVVVLGAHLVLSVLAALGHLCCLCVCVVELGAHLVLSVLAALGHLCCLCVCIVVLGAHLVLSVLAALGMCWLYVVLRVHLCVGYMWCLESTYVCWLYELWGAWSAPGAVSACCTGHVLAICGA